jgi:hypothetical protein
MAFGSNALPCLFGTIVSTLVVSSLVPITLRPRYISVILLALSLYVTGSVAAAIFLAEITLHVNHRSIRHRSEIEKVVFEEFHASLSDVQIQAGDGAQLKAWDIRPRESNGASVILFHGVSDNREGVAGYGRMFLHNGYSVLLHDSRAHGESGGEIATYSRGRIRQVFAAQWQTAYPEYSTRSEFGR